MDILIIGAIPPKYGGKNFGGIATHIEGLTEALVNSGNNVYLWYHYVNSTKSFPSLKVFGNTYIDYAIAFFCFLWSIISFQKKSYLTFSQQYLLDFQKYRLRRVLNNHEFDCVHIHSLHNTSGIAIANIKGNKSPIVYTDHGFWQNKMSLHLGSKTYRKLVGVVKTCQKVVFISEFAMRMHQKVDFGQHDKLIKISNPIKIPEIPEEFQQTDNSRSILFFNGLSKSLKIKQLDLLLDAIQTNQELRKQVEVHAICDNEGMAFVEKNDFDFPIVLYPPMSWDEIVQIYLKSQIFVLPSKSESFGLVYLEALIFGLPIVGFKDVLFEFQSVIGEYIGEPYDPSVDDVISLGNKISNVLSHDFNSKTVLNKIRRYYSWESKVNEFIKLYK